MYIGNAFIEYDQLGGFLFENYCCSWLVLVVHWKIYIGKIL